jgi:hypothetical protein
MLIDTDALNDRSRIEARDPMNVDIAFGILGWSLYIPLRIITGIDQDSQGRYAPSSKGVDPYDIERNRPRMPGVACRVVGAGGFSRDAWPVIRKQYNAPLQNQAVRRISVSEQDDAGENGTPLMIGESAAAGVGAVVTGELASYTTAIRNPARLRRMVRYA